MPPANSNPPAPKQAIRPLFLAAGTPLILAISAALAIREFEKKQALVEHTNEVIQTLAAFERSVNRANLLARNAIVLERPPNDREVEAALKSAFGSLESLIRLTGDNDPQQHVMKNMKPVVDDFSTTVRSGPTGQSMFTQISKLNSLTDEMISLSGKFNSAEHQLLEFRMAEQATVQRRISMIFVGAVLLNVVALAWGFVQLRRFHRQREHVRLELETQVEERTKELRNTVQQLERTNADLEKFTYSASHDLQEPLRTVGSYVLLLKRRYEGKLDADADKYIRFAANGAQRMQDLITDMVTFSSLQRATLRWSFTSLDVPLQESLEYLKTLIEERGATVTVEPLPVLNVDAFQMERVFRGLISNSIKFVDPSMAPQLKLSAERQGSEWRISLKDNGIGFEVQYAEKIFDLFSTLHPRGRYPGTGTGLAIARRVVELHSGRIWAESQPDSGATFHFTLPAPADT